MGHDLRANFSVIACLSIYSIFALSFPFDSSAGVFYGFLVLMILVFLYFLLVVFGVLIASNYDGYGKIDLPTYRNIYVYWLPIFLSLVGVGFIVADRIFFRGINPFLVSPAEARNIMSQGDGGVSSVFSLFGNVFQCFSIVPAYYMISRHRYSYFVFLLAFSVSVFSSYLLGGRTPILCFVVICFSSFLYFSRYKFSLRSVIFMLGIASILVFFGVYIFTLRAGLSGLDSYSYASGLIVHLGFSNDFSALSSSGGVGDYWNFFLLVIGYLVHPFYISSDAVINGTGTGNVSFYALLFLASKIIPLDMSLFEHDYFELFLSLPGGLYYDFGILGLIIGAVFLAALYLFGVIISSMMRGREDFPFIIIIFVISTLILSPLLGSINFVFFNFYIFVLFFYFFSFFVLREFSKVSK